MKKEIKAEIIADSINQKNIRITTFIFTLPRIVLAELNTHRALSKNSASSRAIPFKKMLKMVKEDPFVPTRWQKEHKGMQGNEYHSALKASIFRLLWLLARNMAVFSARILSKLGVTKQLCNRLLEPFMWHTVIITGTEWENFFALRAEGAAEIHIQELAYNALYEYNKSEPKPLLEDEWNIPFGDAIDIDRLTYLLGFTLSLSTAEIQEFKVKIATARCARVSYNNFEGKDDYLADIKLHDRLKGQGHMSPFEHCAQSVLNLKWSGNFRGFLQYRKTLKNENSRDSRIHKKYFKRN